MCDPSEFIISSADRATGTPDSFVCNSDFRIPPGDYECLSSTVINTMFTFDSTNNQINFDEKGTPFVASITPGNYTANTVLATLGSVMNAVVGVANTYTWTYSSSTFAFTCTSNAVSTFAFDWGTFTTNSANVRLGWSAANTALANAQTSTTTIDFASPMLMCVHISGVEDKVATLKQQTLNCCVTIPLNVASGGSQYYEWQEKPIITLPTNVNKFTVSLTDLKNKPLLIGGNWTLSIRRRCGREKC